MNRIEKKENGDNSRLVVLSVLDMIKEGGSYPIKGSGLSMWPFLKDGDTLIITKIQEGHPKVGDILLYERNNGQFVFHRLYKIERDMSFTFIGDNQVLMEKNIQRNQILAQVKSITRNGHEIDCSRIENRVFRILYIKCRVTLIVTLYKGWQFIKKTLRL